MSHLLRAFADARRGDVRVDGPVGVPYIVHPLRRVEQEARRRVRQQMQHDALLGVPVRLVHLRAVVHRRNLPVEVLVQRVPVLQRGDRFPRFVEFCSAHHSHCVVRVLLDGVMGERRMCL